MSNSIASVGQLVTVIRSELSRVTVPAPVTSGQPGITPARGERYAGRNLPRLVQVRIRQISRDDPQRGRKAFRVFLEAVLLSTLGEELVADPQFHQMVDDVQRAMEAQPSCAQLIDEAIGQLLARKA